MSPTSKSANGPRPHWPAGRPAHCLCRAREGRGDITSKTNLQPAGVGTLLEGGQSRFPPPLQLGRAWNPGVLRLGPPRNLKSHCSLPPARKCWGGGCNPGCSGLGVLHLPVRCRVHGGAGLPRRHQGALLPLTPAVLFQVPGAGGGALQDQGVPQAARYPCSRSPVPPAPQAILGFLLLAAEAWRN